MSRKPKSFGNHCREREHRGASSQTDTHTNARINKYNTRRCPLFFLFPCPSFVAMLLASSGYSSGTAPGWVNKAPKSVIPVIQTDPKSVPCRKNKSTPLNFRCHIARIFYATHCCRKNEKLSMHSRFIFICHLRRAAHQLPTDCLTSAAPRALFLLPTNLRSVPCVHFSSSIVVVFGQTRGGSTRS